MMNRNRRQTTELTKHNPHEWTSKQRSKRKSKGRPETTDAREPPQNGLIPVILKNLHIREPDPGKNKQRSGKIQSRRRRRSKVGL